MSAITRYTGYMVEIDRYDPRVGAAPSGWLSARASLRIHGTTKMSRVAIAGEGHDSDVMIDLADIAGVDVKKASMMVNGLMTIGTMDGRRVKVHYRKKNTADFDALKADLDGYGAWIEDRRAHGWSDNQDADVDEDDDKD